MLITTLKQRYCSKLKLKGYHAANLIKTIDMRCCADIWTQKGAVFFGIFRHFHNQDFKKMFYVHGKADHCLLTILEKALIR